MAAGRWRRAERSEKYRRSSRIQLAANAADSDGTVTRVEFFNGSTRIGEDTTAAYSCLWRSARPTPPHAFLIGRRTF